MCVCVCVFLVCLFDFCVCCAHTQNTQKHINTQALLLSVVSGNMDALHRLIHKKVDMSCTNFYDENCILVAINSVTVNTYIIRILLDAGNVVFFTFFFAFLFTFFVFF